MTEYRTTYAADTTISAAARAAKARRQTVLRRVRAQRAATYKRTMADWAKAGFLITGSELQTKYATRK